MAKFQQGGSTAEQQQIMEFIQDIVTSPDKYASQGVSEEFLSAIATTMEQNPQGLNDVFTQYAEDVEKAAAVFKAGNQVVSQKLGGKMDYLHCLKNGGATPGCNCSGNVVKAEGGTGMIKFMPDKYKRLLMNGKERPAGFDYAAPGSSFADIEVNPYVGMANRVAEGTGLKPLPNIGYNAVPISYGEGEVDGNIVPAPFINKKNQGKANRALNIYNKKQ